MTVAVAAPSPLGATFDAGAAVGRLLHLRGHEAIASTLRRAASLELYTTALRKRGLAAHVVALQGNDVPFVRAPAVVAVRQGGFALLKSVDAATCTLELPQGVETTLSHKEIADVVGGAALEVGALARPGESIVRRLVATFRDHPQVRRAGIRIVALGLALNLLGMSVPIITGTAMREVLPNGAHHTLVLLIVATLGVALHQSLLAVLRARAARFVELKLQEMTLSRSFETLLGLPFARVHGGHPGELSASLSATEATPTAAISGVVLPLIEGFFALGYVVLLEGVVPGSGLLVACAGALCVVGSIFAARVMARRDVARLVASARQRTALYEVLSGIATLRASGAERRLGARWVGLLADELTASQSSQLLGALHRHVFETITSLLSAGLLFWGASRCLAGTLDVGDLVASLQSCMGLWGAVSQLARVPIAISGLRALASRADMLGTEAPASPASKAPPIAAGDDAIRVSGLWFQYDPESPWLFNGYDLRVARGETVRLRWPSGQGKSTLLRLLAGLYRPAHGSISILGVDAEHARESICYLPQAAVLFPGSILENLCRLSGSASPAHIFEAAAVTGLDVVVKAWAMGFETCVIAGGSNLSSGQKQLVALTAAIASERPILLMDESTAHLDRLTRARLAASTAFAGRTVITVAHDHEPGEEPEG